MYLFSKAAYCRLCLLIASLLKHDLLTTCVVLFLIQYCTIWRKKTAYINRENIAALDATIPV